MADKKKQSKSIYITTNIACNLRCIYCYEKDKNDYTSFDLERAKNTLSSVLKDISPSGTLVNFHGGEPFLSYLKIRELCEWSWCQNFPEKFTFFATSNGTLVHGELQEWLFKNRKRFIVGLSLDGNRKMQNENRSNSFDLIDIDFFTNTWPNQGVKMTISQRSIYDLAEGVIYMHERGIKEIRANLAEMTDWSDEKYCDIYRNQLRKLSQYYLAHPEIQPCSLFNIRFSGVLNNDIRKWCGAGTEMQAIDIDGRKYPCHLFFESVCGKEKSKESAKIDFTDPKQYISPVCSPCEFLPICPTCYGSNYISRGNIGMRDPNLCKLVKIRFAEVALFQYQRIVNSDITKLTDEERYKDMRTLEAIEKLHKVLDLERLQ